MKRTGFKKKTYTEKIAQIRDKKSKVILDTTLNKKPVRKANKGKLGGLRALRKKLWTLFSLFIRTRDKFTCITCGKVAEGSGMHAGHFITGATCPASLYFDERNVHAQCYHCNINLSGNWVIYERKMIERYGQETVDELKLKRTLLMGEKLDTLWYEDKIQHYKLLLQEMQ